MPRASATLHLRRCRRYCDLATLDDDDLDLVSQANPPATTWFLFAGADSEWIRAGVEALKAVPAEEPVLRTVYEAMREQSGPDLDERIAAISGETLGHLSHKAKEYGKLSPKARRSSSILAKRKRVGRSAHREAAELAQGHPLRACRGRRRLQRIPGRRPGRLR